MRGFLSHCKRMLVFFAVMIFSFLCIEGNVYAKLPNVRVLGGSFEEIAKQNFDEREYCIHYLISPEALREIFHDGEGYYLNGFDESCLVENWAPAILMEVEDWKKTRSAPKCVMWDFVAFKLYTIEVERLSENGDIIGLLQEECDDIRKKFGDKYDDAIEQMFNSMKRKITRGDNFLCVSPSPECFLKVFFDGITMED